MIIKNYTLHEINVYNEKDTVENKGRYILNENAEPSKTIQSSGIAIVEFTDSEEIVNKDFNIYLPASVKSIKGLPEEVSEDTYFIVPAMVGANVKGTIYENHCLVIRHGVKKELSGPVVGCTSFTLY